MSKFISKFPAKSGKKPSHSRLLKPDSGWSPKRNDARRSRDTMNSVGIPWTQWGHLWKSTFSSWKSSLMKTKLIFNRIISCFKQSYFSGVFHLLAEFQNWNVWGNLQNIKNDVKKIRQCVRCMNISPKKKSYGTTQKMPKKKHAFFTSSHLLPWSFHPTPAILARIPPRRWTLLDELDDGPSCVPRVCETADGRLAPVKM